MATLRQIEANRQNAARSTGPVTDSGKAASRGNALKHGLAGAGEVLPAEEQDAIARRMVEWRSNYQPADAQEEWFFEQIVVNSVRLDQCQEQEASLRQEAYRARLTWDDDRRLDAEVNAAALANTARTAQRLLQTKQGVEWLLERWVALVAILDRAGSWTELQTKLALDMLGTPSELRDETPLDNPGALARKEIARLERRKSEALEELDDFEQSAAEMGLPVKLSRDMANLRRYEAACLRRYESALKQFRTRHQAPSPEIVAAPEPRVCPSPTPVPTPATSLQPKPKPQPTRERTVAPTPLLAAATIPTVSSPRIQANDRPHSIVPIMITPNTRNSRTV